MIQAYALGIDAIERGLRQALQQRDAFAQGVFERDLAAHGAFCDGRDFGFDAGEVGDFVNALAIDDG